MPDVLLRGGPLDGEVVDVPDARTPLLVEGDGVPEGMVARYRPSRERGVLTFREYDRVAGRVTMKGDGDATA